LLELKFELLVAYLHNILNLKYKHTSAFKILHTYTQTDLELKFELLVAYLHNILNLKYKHTSAVKNCTSIPINLN